MSYQQRPPCGLPYLKESLSGGCSDLQFGLPKPGEGGETSTLKLAVLFT
jgi:hypothetical protein